MNKGKETLSPCAGGHCPLPEEEFQVSPCSAGPAVPSAPTTAAGPASSSGGAHFTVCGASRAGRPSASGKNASSAGRHRDRSSVCGRALSGFPSSASPSSVVEATHPLPGEEKCEAFAPQCPWCREERVLQFTRRLQPALP